MSRIWDTIMFREELDMLAGRLETLVGRVHATIATECPVTHRNYGKPLYLRRNLERFAKWDGSLVPLVAEGLTGTRMQPWAREHAQRDTAWSYLKDHAADDDIVLIADCDEFPSDEALAWDGQGAVSLFMKTALYCVDWHVPEERLPPTAVMCRMGWLREQGGSLAIARDNRHAYPVIRNGGWHFSWIGGPEAHARKLDTATCHTEILATPEAELIRNGTRWASSRDGGGLPVVAGEVEEDMPAFIRERRCPPEWFRPRADRTPSGRATQTSGTRIP